MVDRFQPRAVTKRAIVGAAFLIAGASLLFHDRMPTQPTHDQIPPLEPPEFFPSR
jgi:hypothetical protein